MAWLPQTNARLKAINQPGPSEDFDVDPGSGTPRWAGDVDAYYQSKVRTRFSTTGGALERTNDETLIIPDDLRVAGASIKIQSGDTVVFEFDGRPLQGRIADINAPQMPGVRSTVRLHLEETAEADLGVEA